MATCYVLRLGRLAYQPAFALQLRIVERMKERQPADGVLILLEHDPVITIGRSGGAEHLLASPEVLAHQGVELYESTRGGDITYHGPGQIVGYPIVRLPEGRRDVHRYLRSLEAAIIAALARFGIEGHREPGLTGVWTAGGKIAAIGVAFSRWIAYHGFALNVATDLSAFGLIVPCGIEGRPVTSMERLLGRAPARAEVEDALVEAFVRELGFEGASECQGLDDLPETLIGSPGAR